MLISKSNLTVKLIQRGNLRSFEHASWSISCKNKTLTITGIYHPPPKGRVTNAMFIDVLTPYLQDLLTSNQHNIITGDFNMHIDNPTDNDAVIFNDTKTAFGLIQHVSMATHIRGVGFCREDREPRSRSQKPDRVLNYSLP